MLSKRAKGRSKLQRKRRADAKLGPIVVAAHHAELRKLPALRLARNKALMIVRDQRIKQRRVAKAQKTVVK